MKLTQTLLEWVVTSAALILVVLALRALLGKRVSACLRYALWAVVLVRLLVPVQLFHLPFAGAVVFPEMQIEETLPPVETSVPDQSVGSPTIAAPVSDGVTADHSALAAPDAPAVPSAPKAPGMICTLAWLGWTWLAGSVAVALVLLACNLRFSQKLRRVRLPLEDADCSLPVYVAVGLPSPCLFGVVRAAVYVTPDAAANPVLLRHVLAHETTHFRHGDHCWNILRNIALAVHWWNPLVWLAVILSRRDCELACDEGALKRLDVGERIAYGRTLLALVTEKPRASDLFTCATTMTGDQKGVIERVNRIARTPKRWLWAAVAAVLVMALACVCAFGQVAEPEDEPGADSTPAPTESQTVPESPAPDGEQHTDLNRNGMPEILQIDVKDESMDLLLSVWEGDELIFSEDAYFAHIGYTAIFLCTLDGEDYLLRYHPTMYQGYATYRYQLFTLENDQETVIRENSVDFDLNFHPLMHQSFDPDAIANFMDEINGLLANSVQLINTDDNLLPTFEKEGRLYDSLRFLDSFEETFVRDPSKSLLENLRDFQAAMEGQTAQGSNAYRDETGYRAVLLGYADFTLRERPWDGDKLERTANIAEVLDAFCPDDTYTKIWTFAVVDLDQDGTDEVLVYVCGVASDMGGYLVLSQKNGQVYGEVCNAASGWRNRWFWDLKTDATFYWSNATGSSGGWGTFNLDTGEVEPILYGEGEYPGDYETFWYNGRSSTEAEYWAFSTQQDEKEDAVWYDFTPENLAEAFPT